MLWLAKKWVRRRALAHVLALALFAPGMALLLPPASAAPVPLAAADKTAFFEDFESGALDAERWQLPTSWGVEKARLRPWDHPGLPTNDANTFHLSDSTFAAGGRYANATHTAIETNWIDLTEASAGARLRITHRFDFDAGDDAAVVFARTDLLGWSLIAPETSYSGPSGYAGLAENWEVSSFDLGFFGGSRMKLAFQITAGDNAVVGDGWQIDSVAVTFTTTSPQPDLRTTEVQVYNSLGGRVTGGTAGEVLEVRVNVTNVGSSATSTAVPVFFFDGTPSTGRFLGQGLLPGLSPQGVATASVQAVLPAGTHTLSALIDPGRILVELSTANNVATTSITLTAADGVDLALLSSALEVGGTRTDGARPGQIVRANMTVANLGATDLVGLFTFGVYLEGSGSPARLAEDTRSLLAAGEFRQLSVNFSAIEGNLSLLIVVDFLNGINETNEANNELHQNFTVTDSPPADLLVLSVVVTFQNLPTNEVSLGQLLVIRATVRNGGTQPIEGAFAVGVFLGDPDAGGSLLWTRTVPGGLAPNGTAEVRGTWAAEVGQRTLYAYADIGREVFESDELNNKQYASVHVQGDQRANLEVNGVRFTVLGSPVNRTQAGAPVRVEVTMRNTGVNTTIGGEVALARSNPWVSPLASNILRAQLPTSLVRNTDLVIAFEYVAEPGTVLFYATADYGRAIDEVDEFDNQASATLVVSPDSPDLTVGAVSVKSAGVEVSTLYPSLNVTVSAEVTNGGSASVEVPFRFELWAGEPDTLGAVRLAEQNVSAPFSTGDTVKLQVSWFAAMPTAGASHIVARADPAGVVVEADRANNQASKEFQYITSQKTNLRVERVELFSGSDTQSSATAGANLTIRVEVKNDSPAPYLGGAVLEVRNGELVVFTAPIPRLDPQQSITFDAQWIAVEGAALQALVDSLGAIEEDNEADNAMPIVVAVAPVPTTPWGLYIALAAVGGAAAVGLVVMRRRGAKDAPIEAPSAAPPPAPAPVMATRPAGPPRGAPPPGARPPPAPQGAPRPQGARGPPPPGWRPPAQGQGQRGPPPPGWRPPPQGQRPPPQGARGPPPPGWRPPPQGQRPAPPSVAPVPAAVAPVAPVTPAPVPAEPARPALECPSCATPVEPEWVLCPTCNAELHAAAPVAPPSPTASEAQPPSPAASKCPQCGDPTELGWTVCPNCGTSLAPPAGST